MSKHRRAAKVDANQGEIVTALRAIPGVTVQLGMDDILIGYRGVNYWIEIKEPDSVSTVTGEVRPSCIKDSQHKLVAEWKGQYDICHDIGQILKIINIKELSE